ncbi:MAG: gamma-glutamyltransferase, partial [Bacteroidota bacterium]
LTYLLFIISLLVTSCSPPQQEEKTEAPVVGTIGQKAMVSSVHQLASEVGKEVLLNGGNAFDAAVAVQFALAVVYPEAGNIGGGGFAVIRTATGEIDALDFREKAPLAATETMYQDEDGEVITDLSRIGHLAAGVPGSVDGMVKLHEKYGSADWATLVQPAVDLAKNGYVVEERGAKNLMRMQESFAKYNGEDFYLVEEWEASDTVWHKDLETTMAFIRDNGRAGFYEGEVAQLILAEMEEGNGLITQEDLNAYQSQWRAPLVGEYKGHRIISMPPPSSGGVALLQLLSGSSNYDFSSLGHNSPEQLHVMVELCRRVYADRASYLGDPDYYDVPVDMLLSDDYNSDRFSTISMDAKTPSSEIKEGEVEIIESIETTHFSIVDEMGNAVSITTTVKGYFGNKVMVDGAGFFLNNEMDDFSAKPGVPNQFGLTGNEANAIQPEKRMLSSMTPTIVDKDGELVMVVGTPGGSTIITAVYQTIINVIDHGMTMQEAVNAKKIHHQWLPDNIIVEEGAFDEDLLSALKGYGHEIDPRSMLGKMDCILIREDGTLEGASDYTRSGGVPAGY